MGSLHAQISFSPLAMLGIVLLFSDLYQLLLIPSLTLSNSIINTLKYFIKPIILSQNDDQPSSLPLLAFN